MSSELASYTYPHLAAFIGCLALTWYIRDAFERKAMEFVVWAVFSCVFVFTHAPLLDAARLAGIDTLVVIAECLLAAYLPVRLMIVVVARASILLEGLFSGPECSDVSDPDIPPVAIGPDGPER